MFLQRRGQVIMTIELLDTEEAQAEDPVEVQVSLLPSSALSWAVLSPTALTLLMLTPHITVTQSWSRLQLCGQLKAYPYESQSSSRTLACLFPPLSSWCLLGSLCACYSDVRMHSTFL